MMKSILQNQRIYIDKLSKERLITREVEDFAKKQLKHNLVKIITGSRRVGKSTLAYQILKNKKFGYVNFDDPDLDLKNINFAELTQTIDDVYKHPEYILLDEIQNVPNWEKYVNSLQKEGKNLVITGSNAKMLSSEIATTLTGRAIEINMLPFSIKELKSINKFTSIEDLLMNGTFPEVLLNYVAPDLYYSSLLNSTLIKDIVVRHNLRNIVELENLSRYLLSSLSNLFTYTALANKLKLSVPSTIDYVSYLEESYLFYTLPKFSFKQSEIVRAPHKVYVNDFAFAKFNAASLSKNLGAGFENLFFLNLLRKGYKVGHNLFYANDPTGGEVDFLTVEKDNSLSLYQVAYSVKDEKTLAREMSSLIKFSKAYSKSFIVNCYLVVNDESGFKIRECQGDQFFGLS